MDVKFLSVKLQLAQSASMDAFSGPDAAWAFLASVANDSGFEVGIAEKVFDEVSMVEKTSFLVTFPLDDADFATGEFGPLLLQWAERWNARAAVDILVSLHPLHPNQPAEVRLLRPMMEYGSAGILNGCLTRFLPLYKLGHDPQVGLPQLLMQVREALRKGAAPRLDTAAFTSMQAFKATQTHFMQASPLPPTARHKSGFARQYRVLSSTWAEMYMQAAVPDDFTAGGKILMPASALELLMRSELSEVAASSGPRTGPVDPMSILQMPPAPAFAGGGPEGSPTTGGGGTVTSSAMVFELVGAKGIPLYVGVKEFTSPHPDVLLLPPWMLAECGLVEGSTVTCTRVDLPPLHSITVQPHSSAFATVDVVTGLPHREFLEQSLNNYSALQLGVSILCDGGQQRSCGVTWDDSGYPKVVLGEDVHRFTVVRVSPDTHKAAALFVGFAGEVTIELLPAADSDSFTLPAEAAALQPAVPAAGGSPPPGVWRGTQEHSLGTLPMAAAVPDPAAGMLAHATSAAAAAASGGMIAADLRPSLAIPLPAASSIAAGPSGGHVLGGPVAGSVGSVQTAGGGGGGGGSTLADLAREREERRRKAAEAATKRAAAP